MIEKQHLATSFWEQSSFLFYIAQTKSFVKSSKTANKEELLPQNYCSKLRSEKYLPT